MKMYKKLGSPMNMSRHHGFTLIELMTVVIVIGILGSLAYPSYVKQARKSKRSSATAEIISTAAALQSCFTINLSYQNPPCSVPNSHDTSDGNYTISVDRPASSVAYTITATPKAGRSQANDAECTSFSLTNVGSKSSTGTNPNCW